jgi:hypothetical protein
MLFSSGGRQNSKAWRRHADRASRPRDPWWAGDTFPGLGPWPPPIRLASETAWWEARHGRVVTTAVRPPVRAATRWIRVVSRASARVTADRRVGSRRAGFDVPAPGAEQDVWPLTCGATTGTRHAAARQAPGRA